MTPPEIETTVAVVTVVVSWIGSAFIAGVRFGTVSARLDQLERTQATLATKEQLGEVSKDVAEIKGMFRLTLRKDDLGDCRWGCPGAH